MITALFVAVPKAWYLATPAEGASMTYACHLDGLMTSITNGTVLSVSDAIGMSHLQR